MSLIENKKIAPGLYWVSVPSKKVFLQAGCPADSVKHLIKHGVIRNQASGGALHETGPNCLLLSDLGIQNGQFANLAEFTMLQMFYRQGMLIPNHPGYSKDKPIMIGNSEQIKAQLDYVFRGNYGLIDENELIEAGMPKEQAQEMMRLKLKFAFGKIQATHDLIDCRQLGDDALDINGVLIKRTGINKFRISVDQEFIDIDLNLAAHEAYQPTYKLNFQRFAPEFFSVIHSGEGDGWDIHRPAMASIICYGPDVYLIDAGPHITHTLRALGLSLNSIRGIFQTHGHDDHFAGLTELMLGDRKLEYYSTSVVRHSVNKKMQSLLSVKFPVLERFFTIHDLVPEEWNNIDGLEVQPSYSPHPVETNTFQFRTVTENGHRTYHHLADICSFSVLQRMIEPDPQKPGISLQYFQRIKDLYLQPADLKKIDIGGGMIHGHAEDFQGDRSKKIILAHTADELSPSQLSIGTRALFGQIDHLVKSHIDNRHEVAARSLHHYFPTVPFSSFYELLNQPIESLEPGSALVRQAGHAQDIFLVLSGIVAAPKSEVPFGLEYVAGYLVGDDPDCPLHQLISKSFAEILRIPRRIFDSFLERYNLKESFSKNISRRRMLQNSDLFQSIKWSPLLNKIAKSVYEIQIKDQQIISHFTGHFVFILESGHLSLFREGYAEELKPGQFCYEDNVITDHAPLELQLKALENSRGYLIPHVVLKDIPAVEWKLLETYKRRSQAIQKAPALHKNAS
jgi:hemerythrin